MRKIPIFLVVLLIALSLVVSPAGALGSCGDYYVVQQGDTLYSVATSCGYTVDQLIGFNPGLTAYIYPGQQIYFTQQPWQHDHHGQPPLPPTQGWYYTVQAGDTLSKLALRFGITRVSLANANNLYTWSWLYTGQSLLIPTDGGYYPPPSHDYPEPAPPPSGNQGYTIQPGDTLKKLAYAWGVTVWDILKVNPQIHNANVIYVGQVINTPFGGYTQSGSYYIVKSGDTLRKIAGYFGTTVYNLLALNPTIWNPNIIYVGTVLRVQ